jgi:hypothetical protein
VSEADQLLSGEMLEGAMARRSIIAGDDDRQKHYGNEHESRYDHKQLFQHKSFHLTAIHDVCSRQTVLCSLSQRRIAALSLLQFRI